MTTVYTLKEKETGRYLANNALKAGGILTTKNIHEAYFSANLRQTKTLARKTNTMVVTVTMEEGDIIQ